MTLTLSIHSSRELRPLLSSECCFNISTVSEIFLNGLSRTLTFFFFQISLFMSCRCTIFMIFDASAHIPRAISRFFRLIQKEKLLALVILEPTHAPRHTILTDHHDDAMANLTLNSVSATLLQPPVFDVRSVQSILSMRFCVSKIVHFDPGT